MLEIVEKKILDGILTRFILYITQCYKVGKTVYDLYHTQAVEKVALGNTIGGRFF